jgi:DNA-binding transcriptional LysR family regulator
LTHEGEQMARYAPSVLESWSAALQCGHEDRTQLAGKLKVVAPVALGQRSLAIILARFLRHHPSLSIELELRDDPIDLQTAKYDLWVRVGATPDNLVVQDFYRVKRLLVAAPRLVKADHPKSLAPVRALRLRPFTPSTVKLTHNSGEIYRLAQRCALTSDHVETVRLAALEGAGYAVLPLWAVKHDLAEHKLVRLCPAWEPPSLKISLAFLPNPNRAARVNALISYLRRELKVADGAAMTYFREQGVADTIEAL